MLLSGTLNQVWGMINGLQIFVMTPLIGIPFPDNSKGLIESSIEVASFDFIPTDQIYDGVFDGVIPDEDDLQLSEGLMDTGFESEYFMTNAGSLLIFFFIQVFCLAVLVVLYTCQKTWIIWRKPYKLLKKKLLFNPILRLLLEAILDFSFCIFLQQASSLDKTLSSD